MRSKEREGGRKRGGGFYFGQPTFPPPPPSPLLRAPHDKETDRALASAAASLARRPHSRAELAAKLRRRGYDAAPAAAALDRLTALGLQDDAEFAATFARSKWRSCTWAPARIERELVAGRGVAPADARAAVEAVFGSRLGDALKPRSDRYAPDEEEDGGSGAALTLHLLDAARARDRLARALPRDARRRRLVGWLGRRGHGWGVISGVLRELEL